MKKQVVRYVEKYKHITTINELIFPVWFSCWRSIVIRNRVLK